MNIQQRYNEVKEGKFTQQDFLTEAKRDSRVNKTFSQLNSFDEVISIFKMRGFLVESTAPVEKDTFDFRKIIKESIGDINDYDDKAPHPEKVNAFEYEKGWRYELNAKKDFSDKGILDAQHKAIKNLEKDALYYTRIEMGKHQPTEDQIKNTKMIDISKGKDLKAPNQMKELKGKNSPGITDEERMKIEKIKTELYECFKKKSSSEQLKESAWSKIKALSASLHQYKPKSKEYQDLEDKINNLSGEKVNEVLDKLQDALNEVDPKFPNCESQDDFQFGIALIGALYSCYTYAPTLPEDDPKYLPVDVVNTVIEGLRLYVEGLKEHELSTTYKYLKESQVLNEEVTVTAGEGLTQILQKMTGVNLGASQSVDNLKTAIGKVGNGDYNKGLEVVKKLFANNGSGSVDQQIAKLTDLISKGGKLGDIFSKTQGSFGSKGLFSIKVSPQTVEKIVNGAAKIANKASQALDTVKHSGVVDKITQHASAIKQAGNAAKQALNSDLTGQIDSLLKGGLLAAAGLGTLYLGNKAYKEILKYAANKKANDSRYSALQHLQSMLVPVKASQKELPQTPTDKSLPTTTVDKELPSSTTNKKPIITPYNAPPSGEPIVTPYKSAKNDTKTLPTTAKKGLPNSTSGKEDITAPIDLNPEDTSATNTTSKEKPKARRYTPAVTTVLDKLGIPKEKWDEIPATGKTGNVLAKDIKDYVTKNPEISSKKAEKEVSPTTEELTPGKPTKYKPGYKDLVKPNNSIKFSSDKDDKGVLLNQPITVLVDPKIKKEYDKQAKAKAGELFKAINKIKEKLESPRKESPIIVDFQSEEFDKDLIPAINKKYSRKINKVVTEQQIIDHLKNLLFESLKEDVYTPTLNTTMPFEKGRNIDRRDLERELRNNTPSDNQDYNDNIAEDASIYNSRIDSERLSKINELIRQMGDDGIIMYNKYAEDNGCPPWNGKARIFNPVVTGDDNDRQYVDGEGKKRYMNEQTESNFVPEAQGFIQTINDIYKNCTSKTGLKPFTDHLKNTKFDVEKKQPKLIEAFLKYTLKTCKPEHKEELQKALEDVKAKYRK